MLKNIEKKLKVLKFQCLMKIPVAELCDEHCAEYELMD